MELSDLSYLNNASTVWLGIVALVSASAVFLVNFETARPGRTINVAYTEWFTRVFGFRETRIGFLQSFIRVMLISALVSILISFGVFLLGVPGGPFAALGLGSRSTNLLPTFENSGEPFVPWRGFSISSLASPLFLIPTVIVASVNSLFDYASIVKSFAIGQVIAKTKRLIFCSRFNLS